MMIKLKIQKFVCLVLLGLVLATLTAGAQNNTKKGVDITGEFADKVNGKLTLTFRKMGGGRPDFDSATVVNGKFRFFKATVEPVVLTMGLDIKNAESGRGGALNYNSFFLNPGEVKMTGSAKLAETKVTGSGTLANADYQTYSAATNAKIAKLNQLNSLVPAALPIEIREERWKKNSDSLNLVRDKEVYLKTIKDKPKSLLAVFALNQYAAEPVWTPRKKMQPELIEKLLATLPAEYQNYPSLLSLKQELRVSKLTGIGKPSLDFSLRDTAGRMVNLSDFKGKYVFLDFWASWCVPCRKENPNVRTQYEKYKNKGFTVLSVSMDKPEARKAWLEAIKKDNIGMWTHVVDEAGFGGIAGKSYYVTSIPTNFLIGPDGKFLGRNLYGANLDKALKKLFLGN